MLIAFAILSSVVNSGFLVKASREVREVREPPALRAYRAKTDYSPKYLFQSVPGQFMIGIGGHKMMKFKCILVLVLSGLIFFTGCGTGVSEPDAIDEGMVFGDNDEDWIADDDRDAGDLEYMAGYWDDDVYINRFADISFTLPRDWTQYSTEQHVNQDIYSFYGMCARDSSGNSSIVTRFTLISDEDIEGGFSAVDYLAGVSSVYAEINRDPSTFEIYDQRVGGKMYKTFFFYRDDGRFMRYFARMIDNYVFSMSIVTPNSAEIDVVVDFFR